jgi:hypothetical protein
LVAAPDEVRRLGGVAGELDVRALVKNLLKLWPALWTFATTADVEPTAIDSPRG